MSLQTALRCPHCAAMIEADDRFCEACGAPLRTEVDADSRRRRIEESPRAAAVSDRGRVHERNDDACALHAEQESGVADRILAVVCDGVSSAVAPDVAARVAADSALVVLRESSLTSAPRGVMREAITAANRAVLTIPWVASPARSAPSCTIVAAVVAADAICVGWVGDSRAYWIDAVGAQRLTRDDSWAEEQVASGRSSEAEAAADPRAHMITAWLGADAPVDPVHTFEFEPPAQGWLILCTDGLWNYASDTAVLADLVRTAARTDPAPLAIAEHLTGVALDAGGHDNITVAVVAVSGSRDPEEQR